MKLFKQNFILELYLFEKTNVLLLILNTVAPLMPHATLTQSVYLTQNSLQVVADTLTVSLCCCHVTDLIKWVTRQDL